MTDSDFSDESAFAEEQVTMLVAFEGWNDAGEAATSAINHLIRVWEAEEVKTLTPDDYYDFQFTRPSLVREKEIGKRLVWPSTRILQASVGSSQRKVILVQGVEPAYHWRSFSAELLAEAHELGVTQILFLGALLTDVPHSRPLPVSLYSEDTELQNEFAVEESTYEGSVGIVSVVSEFATLAGIPNLTAWVAVPHYVAQPPSPKAELALLKKIEDVIDTTIEMQTVIEDSEAWERGVDDLAENDSEVAEYVQRLEEAKDQLDLPEASGDAIARELERFLRRRRPDS